MDISQIKAEMLQKPDPHVLLEWIDGYTMDEEVSAAIGAYYTGLEQR